MVNANLAYHLSPHLRKGLAHTVEMMKVSYRSLVSSELQGCRSVPISSGLLKAPTWHATVQRPLELYLRAATV